MALNAILKKHACTGGGWWSTQNTIYTVYIYSMQHKLVHSKRKLTDVVGEFR